MKRRDGWVHLIELQTFLPNQIPKFDFHMHTSYTDGKQGVVQMHQRAVEQGLKCILFSEHARKSSGVWFDNFTSQIRDLPFHTTRALVGAEVKVLNMNGELDVNNNILEKVDLLMGVVHRFPGEDDIVKSNDFMKSSLPGDKAVDLEYRLASSLLENPNVDILGHPFGMSYKRFNTLPSKSKICDLIKKAALHDKAFEINSHYHPDPWFLIRKCLEYGTVISLGSNAHQISEVGNIIQNLKSEKICNQSMS